VHSSTDWQACRAVFVERFPNSGPILVALGLHAVRQTSGFGASRSVAGESVGALLAQ
jgi:hypothetical protein